VSRTSPCPTMHSDRYVPRTPNATLFPGLSVGETRKKSDDYSTCDQSYVHASISQQHDNKWSYGISTNNASGCSDFILLYVYSLASHRPAVLSNQNRCLRRPEFFRYVALMSHRKSYFLFTFLWMLC